MLGSASAPRVTAVGVGVLDIVGKLAVSKHLETRQEHKSFVPSLGPHHQQLFWSVVVGAASAKSCLKLGKVQSIEGCMGDPTMAGCAVRIVVTILFSSYVKQFLVVL